MPDAPGGIVGNFAATRPLLANTALALGFVALAVTGVRQGSPQDTEIIITLAVNAIAVIGAPMVIAALQPSKLRAKIFYLGAIIAVALLLLSLAGGRLALPPILSPYISPPALWQVSAAIGWTAYLLALSPLTKNTLRLGVIAPFAALLGVIGASGYLSAQSFLTTDLGAAAIAIGLTVGIGAGVGVSAEFSKLFAKGFAQQRAAAAGGHAAVALGVYALLAVAGFFGVATYAANFGAVHWGGLWAGFTTTAAPLAAVMFAAAGVLSLINISEVAAVEENLRRQWFKLNWRPVRLVLPPATAIATSVIFGVMMVVGLFEAGVTEPMTMALFFAMIAAASAVTFMSLRTTVLITALLATSMVLAEYVFSIVGLVVPELLERASALTLCAIALGHLTVSWRDASDEFRNVRDITENALSDGVRRYVLTIGAAAVSLFVSAKTLQWTAGINAVPYLMTLALICLVAAPAMMTALRSRFPA